MQYGIGYSQLLAGLTLKRRLRNLAGFAVCRELVLTRGMRMELHAHNCPCKDQQQYK